ncbi:MAG: tryptophan synthase subunit alpha [Bacteroidales bacterium]
MNALTKLFKNKNKNLISIYFTAGFPEKDSTVPIIHSLQEEGIDFLEVGFPFSDPLADGPVIQQTSHQSIMNGMNLELLLDQLKAARKNITIPLILMGYLNPVLQMGMEVFCRKADEAGISGVILPDLPPEEYEEAYQDMFKAHDLHMIFLITPETSSPRIEKIDKLSTGFIYAVSSSSTTGKQDSFSDAQTSYLKRLQSATLQNPVMTGFGIHNKNTLQTVWEYSAGAIIGTAYLKSLMKSDNEKEAINGLKEQLGINRLD